jgi:hypothetical protein
MVLGVAELDGRPDLALDCKAEMLAVTDRLTAGFHRSAVQGLVAVIDWYRGAVQEAEQRLLEALRLKAPLFSADRYGVVLCLETLAWVEGANGRHERAALLLGLADILWTQIGVPISGYAHLVRFHDDCLREASAAIGAGGSRAPSTVDGLLRRQRSYRWRSANRTPAESPGRRRACSRRASKRSPGWWPKDSLTARSPAGWSSPHAPPRATSSASSSSLASPAAHRWLYGCGATDQR